MNDSRIRTRQQVLHPSENIRLMLLSDLDVYVVQVDDGRDYVDARLLVTDVAVGLVRQLTDVRYERVDEVGLVVRLDLFELVDQTCVEVFGRFELDLLVARLQVG